jgi:preprotein translocase subunit YajC
MFEMFVVAQNGGANGGGGGGLLSSIVLVVLIFLIFWFIVIRPEQKKQEEHQDFLESLKVGDQVVTAGGLFGEVKAIDGDTVKLQVNRDTRIRVLRQQIEGPESEYLGSDDDEEDEEQED